VRALGAFIESNQLLAIGVSFILLFILFWIFKYFIKNLIAGVLFKLSGHFSLNDLLQAGEYSGRIRKFGLHSIELETESAKSIFIPYSTILEEVNIRWDTTEMKTAYIFKIDVPKKDDENDLTDQIKTAIISLPWISVKLMPQVKLIAKTDSHFTFEISIHAISKSYLVKTEKYLEEKFGDSNESPRRKERGI
jgi:small-conductance mechanosensitive channel